MLIVRGRRLRGRTQVEERPARLAQRPARRCIVAGKRDGLAVASTSSSPSETDEWERPDGRGRRHANPTTSCSSTSRAARPAMPRPWSTTSRIRSATSSPPSTGSRCSENTSAHERDRQRLGQVRLGQDLRPVDRRRHDLLPTTWTSSCPPSCCRRSRTTTSTTFCAPPTMYRFMLQEDVRSLRSLVQRGELRHRRRAAERAR